MILLFFLINDVFAILNSTLNSSKAILNKTTDSLGYSQPMIMATDQIKIEKEPHTFKDIFYIIIEIFILHFLIYVLCRISEELECCCGRWNDYDDI